MPAHQGKEKRPTTTHLLEVHVVQVVLHKLDAGVVVSRVELVGDVPAQGTELASLLHHRVHETHSVQHGLPLWQVGVVQEVLGDVRVRPLQPGLHALGRLIRELDGDLAKERKQR